MSAYNLVPADQAAFTLHAASRDLRHAQQLVEELEAGVTAAVRALMDAELEVTKSIANLSREDNPSLPAAGEAMQLVARRSRDAAEVGRLIEGRLASAGEAVQSARAAVYGIDREGLTPVGVADVAVLQDRVNALPRLIELMQPMAAGASDHLLAAAHIAARSVEVGRGEATPTWQTARLATEVNEASNELGRATQDTRHLDRVGDETAIYATHTAGYADEISEQARARMQAPSRDPGTGDDKPWGLPGPGR
jgi:hypothetical protein